MWFRSLMGTGIFEMGCGVPTCCWFWCCCCLLGVMTAVGGFALAGIVGVVTILECVVDLPISGI